MYECSNHGLYEEIAFTLSLVRHNVFSALDVSLASV